MKNQPLLLAFFILLKINLLQAQWHQTPTPEGATVFSLAEQNGVLFAGAYTRVFRSFDGQVWSAVEALNHPSSQSCDLQTEGDRLYAHIYSAYNFPTESTAVFYSTDQGDHWTSIPIGADSKRVFFSGHLVFRLDINNVLYKTENDGTTWQQIWADPGVPLHDLVAWNDQLLLYSAGSLLLSPDTGITWTTLLTGGLAWTTPNQPPQSRLFAIGSSLIISSDWFKTVSTDGGVSWTTLQDPALYGSFYDVAEFQGVLYASHLGGLYSSHDGGLTWIPAQKAPGIFCFLPDGDTLRIGGVTGVFYSADAENWEFGAYNMLEDPSGYLTQIQAFPGGYAVKSFFGDLFITGNNGQSWDLITYGVSDAPILFTENGRIIQPPYRYDIAAKTLDSLAAFGSGTTDSYNYVYGDGYLLAMKDAQSTLWRSADEGLTWDSLPPSPWGIPRFMGFAGGRFFITHFFSGYVSVSEDAGITWNQVTQGMSAGDVAFAEKELYAAGDAMFLRAQDSSYRYDPLGWQRWAEGDLKWTGGDGLYFGYTAGADRRLLVLDQQGTVVSRLDSSNYWLDLTKPMSFADGVLYGLGSDATEYYPVIYSLDLGSFQNGALSGQVFLDTNANGIFEPEESPLTNNVVSGKPLNFSTTTNSSGNYMLLYWQPNDTIRAQLPSLHYISQPAYYLANQAVTNLNFAIQPVPGALDHAIHATAHTVFRPGFKTDITLTCSNPGTVDQAVTLKAVLPEFMDLDSAVPAPDAVVADTIFWNLPGLPSLGSTSILLTVKTENLPPLGAVFDLRTEVGSTEFDLHPADNVSIIHDTLVGSYDPNDKAVFPVSVTPEQIASGAALTYRVRFQNTGTYPASIVRVLDTLSNDLDISTLRVLSASHAMNWSLTGGNILTFVFQDINLPDSISNEPGSHGFVLFSIQAKPTLPIGTAIANQAAIYFDFNVPVFTNITEMLVKHTVTIHPEPGMKENLHLFPNPASGKITVTWTDKTLSDNRRISINDLSGRTVFDLAIAPGLQEQTLDIRHLPPGLYFLQMVSEGKVLAVQKFVKQ